MKLFFVFFHSFLFLCTVTAEPSKADRVYLMALEKIDAQDYPKAQRYLEAVLKAEPKHSKAQFKLAQLKQVRKKDSSTASRHQLHNIEIDTLEFEQVTLSEALDGFRALVDQKNGSSPAPNLYILDSNNEVSNTLVSLSLNKVPARAALEYIADLAKCKVMYKEFLIELSPR